MILVTGGSGNIGAHLLGHLAETDEPVRVLARDPSKIDDRGGRFEVVKGDLDDPSTFGPAFDGADRLFMLTAGENVPAQDAALIKASQDAALDHVVMVSSLGAELGGIAGGGPHIPGEELLRSSGLRWTILHPSEFMSNTVWWAPSIRSAGAIFVPAGDGRIGFIDPADIAATGASVVTGNDHGGKTYRLTGPEALSTDDIAARLTNALGKPVKYVDLPEPAFRDGAAQAGMPQYLIDMQITYYAAVREGRVDIVTDEVERLTGRPPRSYADWAAENAAAFE